MTVANMEEICRKLIASGLRPSTPAAVVENGTKPKQRVLVGNVENIALKSQRQSIVPPSLLIVGEVVRLREDAGWYEKLPLHAKRVVVTRPAKQAEGMADMVSDLGGEPVLMPSMKITRPTCIEPLKSALRGIERFDGVVFTSKNAVDSFFHFLFGEGSDSRALKGVLTFAVGSQTARRLRGYGIRADLTAETYTTEGLVERLGDWGGLNGARLLCPRSNIAPPDLIELLRAQGACVEQVEAYSVERDNTNYEEVQKLLENDELDCLTFTSSSTVENFFAAITPESVRGGGVVVASIGPRTTKTLQELNLPVHVEAKEHSATGLLWAIVAYFRAEHR